MTSSTPIVFGIRAHSFLLARTRDQPGHDNKNDWNYFLSFPRPEDYSTDIQTHIAKMLLRPQHPITILHKHKAAATEAATEASQRT